MACRWLGREVSTSCGLAFSHQPFFARRWSFRARRARSRPPPQAKPLAQSLPADAKRDYDAGKLLFEDGDYATALLMYQAAFDRTHDPRLLWNVAVCKKNLRHYAKAATTLARYLAEGG